MTWSRINAVAFVVVFLDDVVKCLWCFVQQLRLRQQLACTAVSALSVQCNDVCVKEGLEPACLPCACGQSDS